MLGKTSWHSIEVSKNDKYNLLFYKKLSLLSLASFCQSRTVMCIVDHARVVEWITPWTPHARDSWFKSTFRGTSILRQCQVPRWGLKSGRWSLFAKSLAACVPQWLAVTSAQIQILTWKQKSLQTCKEGMATLNSVMSL